MTRIYPLKFETILKPVIWGGDEITRFKNIKPVRNGIGESWEISQVKDHVSVVANGPLKGKSLTEIIHTYGPELLGRHIAERFGDKFPLLVKFIDAHDNLSIQVHPNDELALKRHHSFGKTEMWYVISAREGAGLYSGFSQEITPDEYVERVKNDTFMEVLQFHPAKSGDVFFLPAGRVHAIGKGIFIAEIQQTSDITYRIYDYNRRDAQGNSRELHTDLAKDAIDYTVYADYKTHYTPEINRVVKLVESEYFTTSLIEADQPVKRSVAEKDSFVIYLCMEGDGEIRDSDGGIISVKTGDTILVPAALAEIEIVPGEKIKLLECYN